MKSLLPGPPPRILRLVIICLSIYMPLTSTLKVLSDLRVINSIIRMSSSLSLAGPASEAPLAAQELETLVNNFNLVKERINHASEGRSVRLVAVSKTKPASFIRALYDQGHRDFGENYFQELEDKAKILPEDIRWHFIGHLQSSKASKLLRVRGLAVLETLDSSKLARKLHAAVEAAARPSLDVFIQVDTSGEDSKSGLDVSELEEVVRVIQTECSRLRVRGLMTIGAPGDLSCFDKLCAARVDLARYLGQQEEQLELSMGMSADFEEAVRRGASSVRIGSTLFGPRLKP